MNPNTGAIGIFETKEDAEEAGHTVELTEAEAKSLEGVNRKDRRAKLAQFRREQKRLRKLGPIHRGGC